MLSISISQPVVWSPAPAPAVAAASAAAAVTPVQASSRDGQAGMGQSGREPAAQGQATRAAAGQQERRAEADKSARQGLEAAPLLPRPQPDGRQGQQDADAQKAEEQKQQSAEEAARKLQLQDVIVSAWKASAAVVDVVLGRDTVAAAAGAEAATAVTGTEKATSLASERTAVVAASAQRETESAQEDLVELSEGREVVAYDAQGHSSLAPLESGSLVSRHV